MPNCSEVSKRKENYTIYIVLLLCDKHWEDLGKLTEKEIEVIWRLCVTTDSKFATKFLFRNHLGEEIVWLKNDVIVRIEIR